MTLSTNVYVLDPIDHREVFHFCQGMLAKYDEDRRSPEQQAWTDKQDETWRAGKSFVEPDNAWSIANRIGQGLPAILDISYRPNAPLRTPEQAAACYDWCDDDCTEEHDQQACWLDIDFDTAYGYKHNGMGCGDLHAAFVSELGQWLDARGVRWSWRNEHTGEVHGGEDRYERLIDLCSAGFEASAWFEHTVKPVIEAKAAAEGGTVRWF